jgi:competence protein ComEA
MTPAGRSALWIAAALLLFAVVGRVAGVGDRRFAAAGDDRSLELRIDLNGAGIAELESLPGIGQVLASRIEDHRRRNGPFQKIDGLREVPGIGAAKVRVLVPFLTVGERGEFNAIGE